MYWSNLKSKQTGNQTVYAASALPMNNSNKIVDYANIKNQCELFCFAAYLQHKNNSVVRVVLLLLSMFFNTKINAMKNSLAEDREIILFFQVLRNPKDENGILLLWLRFCVSVRSFVTRLCLLNHDSQIMEIFPADVFLFRLTTEKKCWIFNQEGGF